MAIIQHSDLLLTFQQNLHSQTQALFERFEQQADIHQLVQEHSNTLDQLLSQSLAHFFPQLPENLALIAVGGYGRAELFPHSDIDILLLCDEATLEKEQTNLERFIAFLWDTKLNIGHSVRTLKDCIEQAKNDISIVTNLMESRLITGSQALFSAMHRAISVEKMWSSQAFFEAKRQEQYERHQKYDNAEYRLEPNIKSSLGGLRDIQVITWICKRQFNLSDSRALLEQAIITQQEYEVITQGKDFLMRVRFALHMLNGREENRLSFEQQNKVAHYFGLKDQHISAAEQLMKSYYRWAQKLSQTNELIVQLFEEHFFAHGHETYKEAINERFQIHNRRIETRHADTFKNHPSALLELFVLMAKDPRIMGVRANTIRQLQQHIGLIDTHFRQQAENQNYFIELLRCQGQVAQLLNLMKRYGVLAQYIPAFAEVSGQMQHDLFHIYTVDAHTIEVLKHANRLLQEESSAEYPVISEATAHIHKPDLLYLACLFHDIGKGRGGDHSTLGAVDAYDFCQLHGYSQRDSNLVRWLVEQHLLLSYTAQKKDLYDPEVIREFALNVGDIERLNYLFVLTVADINGTNPNLWNSWRASLLRTLYSESKLALLRGLENIVDKQELIEEKQAQALSQLKQIKANIAFIQQVWTNAGEAYFLSESVADIVWQSKAISEQSKQEQALVLIQQSTNPLYHGATQIFIHTKDRPYLFAQIVSVMGRLNLNIVDARIYSSISGYTLDTFLVLDENEELINNHQRLQSIQQELEYYLAHPEKIHQQNLARTAVRLRHIKFPTRTRLSQDKDKNVTVLEVITADRPGLLATIGAIFVDFEINLNNAKITTWGDRVEDIFFITDKHNHALSDEALCHALQSAIQQRLDHTSE